MKLRFAAIVVLLAACPPPPAQMVWGDKQWPGTCGNYEGVTKAWTRLGVLRGQYQEVLDVAATFKSPQWRCAHAEREAAYRGLAGDDRAKEVATEQAAAAGPYEVELMVTTWDRRENDLDRGKRSVWHVVLEDDAGHQLEPIEIVKDKRPAFTVRAEFEALGDFAVPYVARFPHTSPILDGRKLKLRMSGERGDVEIAWTAQ
ncbi:MAG TPA: hypothetical protein VGF94_00960 [Kofleriaceae bacterium]|jgi:hypothetical protein